MWRSRRFSTSSPRIRKAIARMVRQGVKPAEAAQEFGVSVQRVYRYCQEAGVSIVKAHQLRRAVESAFLNGLAMQDVAKHLRISLDTADRIWKATMDTNSSFRWRRDILSAVAADMTASEAAAHVGASISSVRQICRQAGIKPKREDARSSLERRRNVLSAVAAGMTASEAAAHAGVSKSFVYRTCHLADVKPKPERRLTDFEGVKKLLSDGKTQTEVAAILGVSRQRISQIVKQKGWPYHPPRPKNRVVTDWPLHKRQERARAVADAVRGGITMAEAAAKFGLSPSRVLDICKHAGIHSRQKARLRRQTVLDGFEEGMTLEQLAFRAGVSARRVRDILQEEGKFPSRQVKATSHRQEVLRGFAGGLNRRELACRLGLSPSYVSQILREEGKSAYKSRTALGAAGSTRTPHDPHEE